jgi:hypothetical protein
MKKKITIGLVVLVVLATLVAAVPPAVRERIAIYARENSWIANGMDIIWYTGDLSGESARIDGANGAMVLTVPTAVGTATPIIRIENDSVANPLEIRNAASTPVFYVDADGNATYNGFSSGGGVVDAPVRVAAATSIATATPAMVVDSLGVSNLLEVRDATTPVFTINNGGAWSSTGAGTHSSGQTVNSWAVVSAPTAIATATPAMVVNSLGVSTILEVRDAATPVFTVLNGGEVTGKVLRYATAGTQLVCGTTTITNTAQVSHGLTTPAYAVCSLNQAVAGDAVGCATLVGGSVVTVTVHNSAVTPAANSTGASINWCVIGTP